MNNLCPQCGALYTVTQRDLGRRIACKKCRAPLIVAEDGLRIEENVAGANGSGIEIAEESSTPPAAQTRRGTSGAWRLRLDLPTALFGVGMFLVVLFSFFPTIDTAQVLREEAAVTQGRLEDQLDQLEVDQLEGSIRTREDKERAKRAEVWLDKERLLRVEAELAKADAQRIQVWNQRGLLLGFLILSFAGIGFMTTDQTTSRKILGGILLLLIFLAVTQGGVTVSIGKPETVPPEPATVRPVPAL